MLKTSPPYLENNAGFIRLENDDSGEIEAMFQFLRVSSQKY